MEAKAEILSMQTIKPFSATSDNLRYFKLSFLDQFASHSYVSVLLFYSADDITGFSIGFSSLSDKLKASLSDVLSLYYPFCGRIIGNTCVDCNEAGVLYIEAKFPSKLSEILECPQVNVLKQFLPMDPSGAGCINNEEKVLMAVQVSEFSCGGVGLSVCISHKIADGTTVASFLNAWVATAKASGNTTTKPYMEGGLLFLARDMSLSSPLNVPTPNKDIKVKALRLVLDGTSLSRLKAEMKSCNPTRVEAVTALIWKSMMEAARASSGEQEFVGSFATHVMNIRGRMVPPLPEHCIGNYCQLAVTPLVELKVDKRVELQDLGVMVRKAIMKVDADHMSKLLGDNGFDMIMELFKHVMPISSNGVRRYDFTSWTRFPLYEIDFGWGKPTWAVSVGSKENYVKLMPTRSGEGIEAWVYLNAKDMIEFERNPKLLQYASVSQTSTI